MRYTWMMAAMAVLALSGCAEDKKDYQAAAHCQGLGHKPGTPEYNKCVSEERSVRMMEEQRKEYERMKQEDMDRKMRRY
jgi:hypothetical protein